MRKYDKKFKIMGKNSVNKLRLRFYCLMRASNGRLAQLVEHLVYTERVSGSNPLPPTIHPFTYRYTPSIIARFRVSCCLCELFAKNVLQLILNLRSENS